ncbi:hypothetical protein [Cellulomonas gelida]|uniref:Uncharacterized protein n=1 Tax=Cellulomonas gelida TaxID=1712 RepID=A0A4Y3KK66_9CELL|nr:hypothetical protein [Cellulomonas gelida]GEA84412.1 hypothetical protein CGE01nite_16630 [Cellulomonas gelida]GGL26476.1 hypothetical protein GCM10009774_16160 [Cellulomonas gelida]
MTQDAGWPGDWTAAIGLAVRAERRRQGISAQRLSELTAEAGYEIPRNAIVNLEHRRKTTIGVHEIAVLATALKVSPLSLTLPADVIDSLDVRPGEFASVSEVAQWWAFPIRAQLSAGTIAESPHALDRLDPLTLALMRDHFVDVLAELAIERDEYTVRAAQVRESEAVAVDSAAAEDARAELRVIERRLLFCQQQIESVRERHRALEKRVAMVRSDVEAVRGQRQEAR